jgi:hypothetical protein
LLLAITTQQKYPTSLDWWSGNKDGLKESNTRRVIGHQKNSKARYVERSFSSKST